MKGQEERERKERPLQVCITETCCWREQGLSSAGNCEKQNTRPPSTGRTGATCRSPATILHWLRVTPGDMNSLPLLGSYTQAEDAPVALEKAL